MILAAAVGAPDHLGLLIDPLTVRLVPVAVQHSLRLGAINSFGQQSALRA